MNGLNDYHRRHIRISFIYVDELLSEVLRDLDPGQAESPFYELIPDVTPIQRKVMADYVGRIRALMCELLDHFKIPRPTPTISASWAAQTALNSAEIAVLELRPISMKGYGSLSQEAMREIDSMVAQLRLLLDKMDAYLVQGAGQDLRVRLQRLEQHRPAVDLLQVLERIVTAHHGLVEFRTMLEAILERLESPALEIALFGRVKTGKSSLLNYLLETDVLPVGVTPITAVPTRIVYSTEPNGKVWFAEDPVKTIDLKELTDYATEQRNPANSKHVTRILVEIPSAMLHQGITFVDTPGIGSLALSGAAESLAYLPRCDLGIVLVDSASSLNQEDLSLVDLLHRSGAQIMLLLSKADILAAEDRQTAADYVSRQIQVNTGLEVPFYAVSTQGTYAALCDHWLTEVLMPAMLDHQHLADISLRRKINSLRDAIMSSLQRRLSMSIESMNGNSRTASWSGIRRHLAAALAELDAAQQERAEISGIIAKLTSAIIEESVQAFMSLRRGHTDPSNGIGGLLIDALERKCTNLASNVNNRLLSIRTRMLNVLQNAATELGLPAIDDDDIVSIANLPVMDSHAVSLVVAMDTRSGWLGEAILIRNLRKQLRQSTGPEISNVLTRYNESLARWRQDILIELRKSYTVKSDFILAQAPAELDTAMPDNKEALKLDLEILKRMIGKDVVSMGKH